MTAIKNRINGIELLQPNHAGALVLNNGKTINYGVIRKNENELIYFTAKALKEFWSPNNNITIKLNKALKENEIEQMLIESGYIDKLPLDEIERVIF